MTYLEQHAIGSVFSNFSHIYMHKQYCMKMLIYRLSSGLIKYKRSTLILEKCQTLDELQTLKMHPYISVTTQATCHFQYTNNASKYQPKLAQCQHTPLEQKSIPAYRILGTRTRALLNL
ncbi:hypothetical protein ACJX0J_028247 [Zea mays]